MSDKKIHSGTDKTKHTAALIRLILLLAVLAVTVYMLGTAVPAAPEETPVSPEDGNPDTPAGETVTLVIGRGESSTTVSKNLKKAGIVEDAAAFDRFLCNNGYDKKIITGTYEIPYGASEEEIAKIITRK